MAKRPRDYQNTRSPLSQNLVRHLDFKIQEVPTDIQINKLKKSAEKNQKQYDKAMHHANREPSKRGYYEAKALRLQALINWKLVEIQIILRRAKTQEKKYDTQKANLAAEMDVHIKKLAKIRPVFNPKSKITPKHLGNIEQVFGKQKPDVKRVGSTVKPVRKKRFALK